MITSTEVSVDLTTITCGDCGIVFAMPDWYVTARRNDHRTWYCPNGHGRAWLQETREEKLARELKSARALAVSRGDQLEATERSLRAQKAATTRIKNRVAAGVCPCCSRSFQNLRRHMSGQHPDFKEQGE